MITVLILPLQALWPFGSVQAAGQLHTCGWEEGMDWPEVCAMICIVGGNMSGTA